MERIIYLHKKIAPKLIEVVENRYNILRHVYYVQPVGRRALAAQLNIGERIIRAEVDFLKAQGLLSVNATGMVVTPEGEALIADLAEYVHKLRGLAGLEEELARRRGLKEVIIVPGDADGDGVVVHELGRAAGSALLKILKDGDIIAVTGGTTMAEMARAMPAVKKTVTVIPARGGLGEVVEYQANTIAASLAKQLGGTYRLLHIPDNLPPAAIAAIIDTQPQIKEILTLLKNANVLVHGIGRAETMARRRGLTKAELQVLAEAGAVGEALGYYFDASGRVVYSTHSLGLQLDDLARIGSVFAVAGGKSKAEAILAVTGKSHQHVLITDEAAARRMLALLNEE